MVFFENGSGLLLIPAKRAEATSSPRLRCATHFVRLTVMSLVSAHFRLVVRSRAAHQLLSANRIVCALVLARSSCCRLDFLC